MDSGVSESKRVCVGVTGASGYLAGVCITKLIAAGFRVKGSVRSLSNSSKVEHLLRDFKPHLELFEADLLKPSSFDDGLKDCSFVLHTASPFQLEVKNPQADLIDPALKGTENVLRSCAKAGVKRVIVTSSCAAVVSQAPPPAGTVWNEEHWNNDSTLTAGPYRLSKVLAEKRAWELAKELGLDVVTINPALVLGPPTSLRVDSTAVKLIKRMLDGSLSQVSNGCFGCVDVQDVAEAHVRAMTSKAAKGRYVVSSTLGHSDLDLATYLRKRKEFASYPIPSTESTPVAYRPMYSTAKLQRDLGMSLSADSVEHAVVATARFLINNGVVERKTAPGSVSVSEPANLESRHLMLLPDKGVMGIHHGPTLKNTLNESQELAGSTLVRQVMIPEASDAAGWEMHPNGDKILIVQSGRVTVRLELGGTQTEDVAVAAGQTHVIGSGVWHKHIYHGKTSFICIAPGTGTRNRLS